MPMFRFDAANATTHDVDHLAIDLAADAVDLRAYCSFPGRKK